jgi:DNA repair protein RadA/Sms
MERLRTRVPELDRVLGGGLVPGSVVLLSGDPGIGKSTLVLQMIAGLHRGGKGALLVTAEESLDQVGLRASRLGIDGGELRAAASSSLPAILETAADEGCDVLVVDSVQTIEDPTHGSAAGSVVQVRECAAALVRFAKSTGTAVVLIGHVTKEGTVAGPRTLEHLVDAVMSLEGERTGSFRLLRGVKNRFGSCDEVGVFAMDEAGLKGVQDPSAMFLADRLPGVAGSAVFPGLEGIRPVLVEVQALVVGTTAPQPRRVAIGCDQRRLALLLGIMTKLSGPQLAASDIFVAVAGGLQIKEPAADLSIGLALISSLRDDPLPSSTVAVGELGLAGEVRRVPGIERRMAEAERLGFTTALVPRGSRVPAGSVRVVEVSSLHEALDAMPSVVATR